MDKRKFVRQPVDLDARISLEGGDQHFCQIKDFSLGGVFVVCGGLMHDGSADSGPSALEHQPVELQFSAGSGGSEQEYRINGRLARVLKSGIGIEFVEPDPATLLVMQELANKAHKTLLDTQAREANRAKAAGEAQAEEIANRLGIVETLKELIARFLKEALDALFMEANERLFESAKTAPNTLKESECFDSIKEVKNIRSLVEQSFLQAVLAHVVKPGYQQLSGPESPPQFGGELTLVDPEKFQDWLRMKRILEKAGPKFKDKEYELLARLSAVSNTKITESNNPIGLVEICASFYDAVQELGASRVTREAIFEALESNLVAKLGMLYADVNSMFVSKGILPTVEPPKHVVKKNPRSATPESSDRSASSGGHQGPAPEGANGPGHGHAAHPGGATSAPPHPVTGDPGADSGYPPQSTSPTAAGSTPAPTSGPQSAPARAASGQAARGAATPEASAGGGASPSDTSAMRIVPGSQESPTGRRQGAIPAAGRGARPSGSPYQAVRTLLGLQRQAEGTGVQAAPGAPPGSASGAGSPSAGAPGPSYARDEIINALSSVQHLSSTDDDAANGVNLKERIQSALEAQRATGESKQLGEAEDAAIDLTSGLVESIVEDVLVPDEIRSQFKRLQIPLLKAMMNNETFFADSKHPARRVVDQLGALTIPKGDTGTKLREKVNQVVNQIASQEGDGKSEFANAADQLEALLKEQMATYEKNVRSVVKECEQQAEITQSIRKDAVAAAKAQQAVPEEFRPWLERAGRLRVGNRVVIDKAGRPHHEALAWVSSDQEKYVFVDGVGEKASSMIRQQLAMMLKRGLLKVLAESAMPAMERGMHMIMRKMHEDLADRATRDPTTGLLNRKAFLDRVDRAVTDAIQTSSEHVLCYLDLDHFGEINEKWGEIAGDKLLKRFGIVLMKNMGDKGVTARLPEDEFGLVLFGCSQAEGHEFADRLRRAVSSARCYWKGESLPLSVSIGIVPITKQSESVSDLMEAAKAACVRAKESGRDCVEVCQLKPEKGNAKSAKHDVLVVNKILEGGRLELEAQRVEPIGEDADSKPHYEILLRLRNIGGNLMSPEHFMRTAERSNQVTQVDRWVIRTALDWMAKNKRRLLQFGGFAINLSGLSLNDDTLTQYVLDQFMKTKVPPGKVVFEVTETAAIERLSTAEEFLRVMKDFGCRFSLEDFGTGPSSYDYIRQLSVDFVKIDGMFVKDLETSSSDYAMVKSITEIGRYMGKKTIAEDVENEATLKKLKEIGVDYAQGNLVEKPMLLQELS